MPTRKPMIDENGEVRELTAADVKTVQARWGCVARIVAGEDGRSQSSKNADEDSAIASAFAAGRGGVSRVE